MKNIEDKAISEKLGGLDTLPQGYEPNLDSKWELLEASMSKRKDFSKRLVYVWISIAASLLILCSLGMSLYFNPDKEITPQNNVNSLATKALPNYSAEHKNPVENSDKIQTRIRFSRNASHVSIARNTNQPLVAQINTDLLKKDSVVENPEPEIINPFLSAEVVPAKKNKQRYV